MKKIKRKALYSDEILNKYFKIDGNVATVQLVYDTFSELIDNNFGEDKVEKLNSKLFEDIKNALFILPKKYSANIEIEIKNFENYKKDECERIIKENLKLYTYSVRIDGARKKKNGFAMILGGIALLIASYLADDLSLPNIVFDVVNISGTLFVWEGIYLAYVERNENIIETLNIAKKIKNISIKKA